MKGLALVLLLVVCGCGAAGRPGARASTSPSGAPLSRAELQYRLVDMVGAPVYCDPSQYPVARVQTSTDVANAVAALRAQSPAEFDAIVRHEHLDAANLTAADNLHILGQSALLNAVPLTPDGGRYRFAYEMVGPPTANVTGTIDSAGVIGLASHQPAPRRPCPVCLAQWTRIATPSGALPVTEIRPGTMVWTVGADGAPMPAPVLAIGHTPVPAGHLVVHLVLADGRTVDASPGHPLPDGRPVGDLQAGQRVDGSVVVEAALRPYGGAATWDLLPAGPTHQYWADGVLLGSTLG